MIPCGGAKVNRITGFFRAWRGVFAGACPSAPCVVSGAQGVAYFFCRLLTLPLACFAAPIPPAPFPAGRGRSKVYFAGGFAPGTPALDRLRHLQALPCRYPAAEPGRHHSREPLSFGYAANHRLSPLGCKGRSPLHENNLNIPLPRRGRGAGGWGQQSKLKARLAGDQPGKPPFGHRQRPPPRRPAGQATHRASATQVQPVPLSARARGCKGRSPLHENNLNLPLPAGKSALRARAGGWGKEIKPKARLAGDKEGKPPIGHRQRPPPRRPAGQTTHRAPQREG